ncbi:MAG: hypothetical protein VZR53_00155 [Prevotella sp.]|nr:hypothetical protein [Prevotella sp.]
MVCIKDNALVELKENEKFKSWLQKMKESYPDKTDEEIEKQLLTFI